MARGLTFLGANIGELSTSAVVSGHGIGARRRKVDSGTKKQEGVAKVAEQIRTLALRADLDRGRRVAPVPFCAWPKPMGSMARGLTFLGANIGELSTSAVVSDHGIGARRRKVDSWHEEAGRSCEGRGADKNFGAARGLGSRTACSAGAVLCVAKADGFNGPGLDLLLGANIGELSTSAVVSGHGIGARRGKVDSWHEEAGRSCEGRGADKNFGAARGPGSRTACSAGAVLCVAKADGFNGPGLDLLGANIGQLSTSAVVSGHGIGARRRKVDSWHEEAGRSREGRGADKNFGAARGPGSRTACSAGAVLCVAKADGFNGPGLDLLGANIGQLSTSAVVSGHGIGARRRKVYSWHEEAGRSREGHEADKNFGAARGAGSRTARSVRIRSAPRTS